MDVSFDFGTVFQALRLADALGFATNMKHAGSVVERNLLGLAAKGIKHRLILTAWVD